MPITGIVSQEIDTIRKKIVQLFLVWNAISHFRGIKFEVQGRNSKLARILINTICIATNLLVSITRIFQIPILDTSHHTTITKAYWNKWRRHITYNYYHHVNIFSGTISSHITFLHTNSFLFWHVLCDDSGGKIDISRVLVLALKESPFSS